MEKNKLIFITNIPSPYNLDLFDSLAQEFHLNVYYFNVNEVERKWELNIKSKNYNSLIFKKDFFHKIFQKINRNLYFNLQCVRLALTEKSKYYILGGNYFAPNIILLLVILGFRGRTIFWYGERLFPTSNILKFAIKRCLICPVNTFTKAIFAIGNDAKYSYRTYGYSKPIFNTPYAINYVRFSQSVQMKFPNNKKMIFLSSGSLIDRKGYDLAIEAFNLLPLKLKSQIEYWILGDGPLINYLQTLIKPGLTVKFLGFVKPDEIANYYKLASCFLLTSRYDGWGVVVNEAISAGLPLIVTNRCGASEYVDKRGGFVVNCDVKQISDKIEYMIMHPEVAKKFSDYNFNKAADISSDMIAKIISDEINNFMSAW